ncbi:unnamed protein product [Brachionus calyciflorus]|uniref:Uncharacterized protein n=1 Tax=Brachionus calyciflorus TaxID=104777 RepID=A0A813NAD0_9BILA|nr:unnamed protein product [Brachionus calyciflorus]
MNFDDDDDTDFTFNPQSNKSKLASLFKTGTEENSDENLKYKASKQPQPAQPQQATTTSSQQAASSVTFFSTVQAFKFTNNKYEPQGKLGLAILSSQALYRILLYVTKTQPVATIRISQDFKISLQKNNYVTFYDEARQVWSILFDSEELVSNFATQVTLCKCNILQGNLQNEKLVQDLKFNDSDSGMIVESNDSIETTTLVNSWQNLKLVEIENTTQKPFRLKLGKNKLPQIIESLIINMKQGDRKLFVLNSSHFKSFYSNNTSPVLFYDIHILRIKKNKEERANADLLEQMPPLPVISMDEPRSRSGSIQEKTKIINDQINDPKLEKAKVISRMAKLGQQMLPGSNQTTVANEEWVGNFFLVSIE